MLTRGSVREADQRRLQEKREGATPSTTIERDKEWMELARYVERV